MSMAHLGPVVRHPHRRRRPDLPAPRGRDRAERGRDRASRSCGRGSIAPTSRWAARRWPSRRATSPASATCSPDGRSPRALRYALISVHYRASLDYSDDSLAAAGAAVAAPGRGVAALEAYREDRSDDPDLPGASRRRPHAFGDGARRRPERLGRARRPCSTWSASSTVGSKRGRSRRRMPHARPRRCATWTASWACCRIPRMTSIPRARRCSTPGSPRARRATGRGSDRLRDELAARGIAVEDTRDGQRWRRLVESAVADRPRRDDDRATGGGGHGPGAEGHGMGPAAGRAAGRSGPPQPGRGRRPTAPSRIGPAGDRPRARPPDRPRGPGAVASRRRSAHVTGRRHDGPRRDGPRPPSRWVRARSRTGRHRPIVRGPGGPPGPRPFDRGRGPAGPPRDRAAGPPPDGYPPRPAPGPRPPYGPGARSGSARGDLPGLAGSGPGVRPGPGRPPGRWATARSGGGPHRPPGRPPYAPPALPPPDVLGEDEELDRRPTPGRGGLRRPPAGAPAAGRPAATAGAREARPARDQPADPDRRARGRHADGPRRASTATRASRSSSSRAATRRSRTSSRALPSAARRRSCSRSTRSRIPRTSARSCAAPRRPASTACSSRPVARRRSRRPRSRPRPARSSTCCCAPVDDLAGALADLHSHGLRIAGAEADAPLTARQSDLRGPLVIVVGQRGPGARSDRPAPLRPPHADPDARRDRLAQRRRGRVDPPVRGGRPARPGGRAARPEPCESPVSRWSRPGELAGDSPAAEQAPARSVAPSRRRRDGSSARGGRPTSCCPARARPQRDDAGRRKPKAPAVGTEAGRQAARPRNDRRSLPQVAGRRRDRPPPRPPGQRRRQATAAAGPRDRQVREGRHADHDRKPAAGPTAKRDSPGRAPAGRPRRRAEPTTIAESHGLRRSPRTTATPTTARRRHGDRLAGRALDPSRSGGPIIPRRRNGSSAVWPCPSCRRSSIGRAAVL